MSGNLTVDEIKAWRKASRPELIARRAAVPEAERKAWDERITQHLLSAFEVPAGAVVGFCWPYKGEFDARFAVREWRQQGALAALPEVVHRQGPLQFSLWWPGAPMRPGVYDIPVPDGTQIVTPDIAIVPMNAFDAQGYRLGYGGGYFDRTLAAAERRVLAIGVTYEMLRIETIHPQGYDIPMDFVVTEAGVYARTGERLERVDDAGSRQRAARLMLARRLPRAAYRDGYSSPVCYGNEFPGYFGEDPKA